MDTVSTGFSIDVTCHLQEGLLHIDRHGRIVAVNSRLCELLQRQPQIGWDIQQLIAAIGVGAEALTDIAVGDRVVIVVGGRLLEFRSSALVDGGQLWVCEDCSELLRLQAQLAEQGHILASGNEAYMVIDPRGLVRYANHFCEQERGYDAGGMVGQSLADLEQPRGPDGSDGKRLSFAEIKQRLQGFLASGGVHRYDAWHYRKDQSRFPTEISLRPYRMQHETVLLLTARDESERLNFVRDLVEARAKAEESNRAKSSFLAITSHELRTPLTAVIGFCELLRLDYGGQPGDLSRYLELIHASSKGLLRLINDIIDFAKLESRTIHFEMAPLQADALLDALVERWRPQADRVGLELIREASQPGESFLCDRQRLNQVLDNLVGNALKFTNAGSVRVGVQHEPKRVRILVSDTGSGIAYAARERVFDPFFQEEDSTTRKKEGTGLGLYICKSLCRQLGGDVILQETSPAGSTFTVILSRKGRALSNEEPLAEGLISGMSEPSEDP
jgi:PAS domain S-box-containing protein